MSREFTGLQIMAMVILLLALFFAFKSSSFQKESNLQPIINADGEYQRLSGENFIESTKLPIKCVLRCENLSFTITLDVDTKYPNLYVPINQDSIYLTGIGRCDPLECVA